MKTAWKIGQHQVTEDRKIAEGDTNGIGKISKLRCRMDQRVSEIIRLGFSHLDFEKGPTPALLPLQERVVKINWPTTLGHN